MAEKTEAEELRAATREAHEVLKDLRQVVREAKVVRNSLHASAEKALEDGINATVEASLEKYRDTIEKAIEEATKAVFDRFDTLADHLMGETKKAKRQGKSLFDLGKDV
jgi:putative cell wall-binding protein